jgi:dolichol-phosphate mannosyltransferase
MQTAVLLPLSVFGIFSVSHEVKLDWTGAAWTAAVPLMAFGLARANTTDPAGRPCGRPWLRRVWPPTILVLLALYAAGAYHLTRGIPGLGYTAHTELVPVGWRDFAAQVDGIADSWRAAHRDRLLVIGMDRYAIASELAFYSADQARAVADTSSAHLFGERGLMYEQWFPAANQTGRTLLLVAWDRNALEAEHVEDRFGRLEPGAALLLSVRARLSLSIAAGDTYRRGHSIPRCALELPCGR